MRLSGLRKSGMAVAPSPVLLLWSVPRLDFFTVKILDEAKASVDCLLDRYTNPHMNRGEKMINKIMRIFRLIGDIPYRLRCRFKYKHFMIPLRRLSKWKMHEDHERMLHGMMEILCHYVEYQEPWDVHMILDGKVAELRNEAEKQENEIAKRIFRTQVDDAIEIHKIYRWWKDDYPKFQQEIDDIYDDMGKHIPYEMVKMPDGYYQRHRKTDTNQTFSNLCRAVQIMEDKLVAKEEEMMCRLIKVRNRLWT